MDLAAAILTGLTRARFKSSRSSPSYAVNRQRSAFQRNSGNHHALATA